MSQIQCHRLVFLLLLGSWLGNQPGRAQYTANYQTNIISGVTNNWIGNYGVGSNTFANTLLIQNGGALFNSDGYLGYQPIGWPIGSNTAIVTGAGSIWSNSGSYLNIGFGAPYNKMIVNAGGRVYCWHARIGSGSASTGNSVLISDAGSLWDVSQVTTALAVGFNGSGNSLTVSNGGRVNTYMGYIGRHGGNNTALVTGSNSTWSVTCYTYVGFQSDGNTMTLANGAKAVDKFTYISHDADSFNNSVWVTGTNTSWQNSDNVFVGFNGSRGILTISNGAWVTNLFGVLGFYATSSSNNAVVTGGGAGWHCTDSMVVGHDGGGNNLTIRSGGRVNSDYGYVAYNATSRSNSVTVTGTGAVWTNEFDVYIGHQGGANSLMISNGGRVVDFAGIVGSYAGSDNNQALVTGSGSIWSNSAGMFVGSDGANNSLVISQGGEVVGRRGTVGESASSTNNTVRVESGGIWRNQSVCVGNEGSHNALFVDGGTVLATNLVVGFNTPFCDNLVQVDSGLIAVTNPAATAVLEVYRGSLVMVGGAVNVDTLLITNHCAQFMHIGGTLSYRQLILDPVYDADVDGLPNGWEQAYGLNPLNPFDGENDTDRDKMNNLEEYLAGSNPTNAASCLRITSQTISNYSVNVSWNAVGGKSYVVQKSQSPTTGFTDLSPVITVPGTAEITTNYLDVGAATNWPGRFYRIRLGP